MWKQYARVLKPIILVGMLCCSPERVNAGPQNIIINEILANPVRESTGEFVELFNPGDTPVDVAGWTLADRSDINDIIIDYAGIHDIGITGTVVPPHGYALIVDPDYDGVYNIWIQQHADLATLVVLTIEGDRTLGNGLGNSHDTVVLDDGAGTILQFEWLKSAGGNGISWEKILPEQHDDPSNWAPSQSDLGPTPGARNSVAPARYDASIIPDDIVIDPITPSVGEDITITSVVRNQGVVALSRIEVTVFIDADGDSLPDPTERIGTIAVPDSLGSGSAVRVSIQWNVDTPGLLAIGMCVTVPDDDRDGNNIAIAEIRVAFPLRTLIINEIMFDPGEGPEWIELFNRSAAPVDLSGWTIETADSTRARTIAYEMLGTPSQQYAILVSDTMTFRERFKDVSVVVLRPRGGWPTLLNGGTRLSLRDPTGRVIDRVDYQADWSGMPGQSAERIHPDRLSHDISAWGPSAAGTGGTPGEKNSLFAIGIPEKMMVDINPNPFSPDGDGWEDEALIIMSFPASHAVVRMFIYDVAGRRLRTLLDGDPVSSRQAVAWNGLDDYGRSIRTGPYILYLEMVEPNTGWTQALKTMIILANHL